MQTIDVAKLESLDPAAVTGRLSAAVTDHLQQQGRLVTDGDRARLIEEVKNEILGLGPLEPLLRDDTISDILVNGASQVYIERKGKLYPTEVRFQDDAHLLNVIGRIVASVGRRVDEASPMVDARLPDGSRVNAIIPPLAVDGPVLSIRRFGRHPLTIDDLLRNGTLDHRDGGVSPRRSAGAAQSPGLRRHRFGQDHDAQLPDQFYPRRRADHHHRGFRRAGAAAAPRGAPGNPTAQPRRQGRDYPARPGAGTRCGCVPTGSSSARCVASKWSNMLQAMSTGHDGSISTIHANNPRDSLGRLEMMMLLSGFALPERAMRQQIAAALNMVIHLARLPDGSRKVVRITEISGIEGDTIMMQDLFEFVRTGMTPEGKVLGSFRPSGIRSNYNRRLEASGIRLDPQWFAR